MPIGIRHLESIIRVAEAAARMHLREYVRSDDVDLAIQVALDSFLSCQKYSVKQLLHKVKLLQNHPLFYESNRAK